MAADQTQISAYVSQSTKALLERYADAHGVKKAHLVEEALLHHLQALHELPADVIIPARFSKLVHKLTAIEDGSLTVNAGAPSVGRAAIRATTEGFMTAFPDMVVVMDSVIAQGDGAVFHWTWTGTNTGPGGTGRAVRISGYEEWTLDADGLIAESKGHYDEAEYRRQVSGEQ